MKKCVTIADQNEVFEYKTDGTYKRYLDWDHIGHHYQNSYQEILFHENCPPEHQEISEQILRSIEQGRPLPQGVYDISSEIPILQQDGGGMPLPKTRGNPVVITNWHIKPDMRVYQGEILHSSRIRSVEGNVVCTESGNYYILVGRDPAIRNVQNLLAPPGSPNDVYNSLNPLTPKSIAQLLLAEKLVYGDAKYCSSLLLTTLQETERILVTSNLANTTPFETMKDILRSIGISTETVPYTPLPPPPPQVPLPPPTPLPIHIIYSLHRGNDVLNGFPFVVHSNITLRELFLRLLMKHSDIFATHLSNAEPFDGNLRLEWYLDEVSLTQSQGGGTGGWTPFDPEVIDKQLNLQFGEKKLHDLKFNGGVQCRILFRC
jgi:hypothetical protein